MLNLTEHLCKFPPQCVEFLLTPPLIAKEQCTQNPALYNPHLCVSLPLSVDHMIEYLGLHLVSGLYISVEMNISGFLEEGLVGFIV